MAEISLDVCDQLAATDWANPATRVGPRILARGVAIDRETKITRRRDELVSLALVPVVPLEPRLYLFASLQKVSFHDLDSSANAEQNRLVPQTRVTENDKQEKILAIPGDGLSTPISGRSQRCSAS